jgi:hypothetical protein
VPPAWVGAVGTEPATRSSDGYAPYRLGLDRTARLGPNAVPATAGRCRVRPPSLEVQGSNDLLPVVLRRGEEVSVTGEGFAEGCADTGGERPVGCSGNDAGETREPMTDVELVLLSGESAMRQTALAVGDAGGSSDGQLGRIIWTFRIPTDYPLGLAFLTTEGSEPVPVRVRR